MSKTRSRFLVLVVAVLAALGVIAPASAATSPYCGITWGSLPKALDPYASGSTVVRNIRAGQHACFDRVVIDMDETSFHPFASYTVEYVPAVYTDGSGEVVPLLGAADLAVTIGAVGHDENYRATYAPRVPRAAVDVSGFRTLRQVAWLGSYEGQSGLGIGVRARLPFRVFLLHGPAGPGTDVRMVLDVAHRW